MKSKVGLGHAYYEKGDAKLAVAQFEQVIKVGGPNADIYFQLGNSYYMLENIELAIEQYLNCISYNPKKADAWYNLGNAQC